MSDVPVSSYDGTLERTADGGVIRFERHLPYPIREVWDAITDPARLAPAARCGSATSSPTPTPRSTNCYFVGLHTSLARLAPCLAGRPVAWDWGGFAEAQAHYAGTGLAPPVDAP